MIIILPTTVSVKQYLPVPRKQKAGAAFDSRLFFRY
jgi:hypothetical protein